MNYNIFIWEIVTFALISIISSVIYIYLEYQDSNKFYKLFIPKNDSIWERIKVLLAPTLLIMLVETLMIKVSPNFMFAKLLSIVTMSLANPLIFILLFKFSKWDMVVINILTTIGSAMIGLFVSIMILNISLLPDPIIIISMAGIIVIVAFYLFATFCQTDDFIFLDPVTKRITLKKDN